MEIVMPVNDFPAGVNSDGSVLDQLAQRIRAGREAIDQSIRNALRVALDVGDALIEARARVSTGQYGPWLRANCFLSVRSAELYAQLARHRAEIEDAMQRVPDLSLRAAARLIAKPATNKPLPKEPKSELAALLGRMTDGELTQALSSYVGFERFLRTMPANWRTEIERRLKRRPSEQAEPFIRASEVLRRALSLVKIAATTPGITPIVAASNEKEALNALRQLNVLLASASIDEVTIVQQYAKERRRSA
jgi:hypothetical protein